MEMIGTDITHNNIVHTPWEVTTPENVLWFEEESGETLTRCMRTAEVRNFCNHKIHNNLEVMEHIKRCGHYILLCEMYF